MILAPIYEARTREILAGSANGDVPRAAGEVLRLSIQEDTSKTNETTSTVRTPGAALQNGPFSPFRKSENRVSGFHNEALKVLSQNRLILLTNPNRGLNVLLGDATVRIGGF